MPNILIYAINVRVKNTVGMLNIINKSASRCRKLHANLIMGFLCDAKPINAAAKRKADWMKNIMLKLFSNASTNPREASLVDFE